MSSAVWLKPAKAGVLLVASLALIVTTMGAHATPVAASSSAGKSELAVAESVEFGARKRIRRGGGNAAGLAMMGMMIGTIGTMIAAQQRREAYDAAYNRAYAAQYPYGYVPPQPQVYHHPHVHHHRPHFHHGHHGFRHGHHGHRMAAPFIHKRHFHR
jgi:hypothetical protein